MKRVVITGLGAMSPLGNDVESTWTGMKSGKNGISELPEEIREQIGVHVGGQIKDYDETEYFNRKQVRTYDRVNQISIIAAREAAADAKLVDVTSRERIGVNISSGIGGMQTIQEQILAVPEKGYKRVSPLFIPRALINLVAGNVAIDLDVHGITNSIVTACASSTDAIGHAVSYIQSGMVDVMISGGSEATICEVGLAGFNNMKALSRSTDVNNASIPFDENRNGFVMGEGAGVLVLEELEHAKARGAKIYGEVVGYGATCDANHITAPDATGKYTKMAVNSALTMANIEAKDISFINAHGTSTPLNDATESMVFTDLLPGVNVTSSKSMTGHLLGAAGAIEAINVVKSLEEAVITPTINTKNLDECTKAINIVQELQPNTGEYAMSTSLGFGGHNSVLIFKKYEEQ